MNDDAPRKVPEEFNVVLERPQMTDEQWARFINRLLMKEAMRRQPKPKPTFALTCSDEPDFFIVVEVGKG
jgi:hypothetical protein